MIGKVPKEKSKKLIVMSNHLSNCDAFFVCTALFPLETKYIAKGDLFRVSRRVFMIRRAFENFEFMWLHMKDAIVFR